MPHGLVIPCVLVAPHGIVGSNRPLVSLIIVIFVPRKKKKKYKIPVYLTYCSYVTYLFEKRHGVINHKTGGGKLSRTAPLTPLPPAKGLKSPCGGKRNDTTRR